MHMDSAHTHSTSRTAAFSLLAAVGFVAFVGGSFWLAANSTRYVPSVVNGIGSAAVYLSSFFSPAPATISVVPSPVSTTTLPVDATTTTPVATTSPVVKTPTKPVTPPTTSGPETNTTYPISGSTATPTYSGLPDLAVTIENVGYLASSTADSFVASSSVQAGSRPAVKFVIKNVGTNIAAPWRFSATIPTQTAYVFQSPAQQALGPGESIEYVLGFDQANRGANQQITVTANFDNAVTETSTANNTATASLTILGS